MIVKLLLGAVFISVGKFIHKCGFMKVTCHLTDAFYQYTNGRSCFPQSNMVLSALMKDLIVLGFTQKLPSLCVSPAQDHICDVCVISPVLITRRLLTEAMTGQIACLRVFSHFIRLLQSIPNFSCSPLFCFHTFFPMCRNTSVINMWQQASWSSFKYRAEVSLYAWLMLLCSRDIFVLIRFAAPLSGYYLKDSV